MAIKIGIVSDLHAEFWDNPAYFEGVGKRVQDRLQPADIILLAGDIDNGRDSVRTAKRLFPSHPVCLVAGNHEFYQRAYLQTLTAIRQEAENTNIHFLHRDSYIAMIDDDPVRVLGVTLWTDFNLSGSPTLSLLDAKRGLNDFRCIQNDIIGQVLKPKDTLMWHNEDKAWLQAELDKPFDGKTIVMTHHAPVSFAISPRFVGDWLSPCFASNLETMFVRDDVNLVVWGHTHYSVDQMIETTRFVSSQAGYVRSYTQVETDDFGCIVSL